MVKSYYRDIRLEINIGFQIKAFPRENNPETITSDFIKLLEKKKNVQVDKEVLLIYSHFTQGIQIENIQKIIKDYPYESIIQIFWTNKNTLNFLKLKPLDNYNKYKHFSIAWEEVFNDNIGVLNP